LDTAVKPPDCPRKGFLFGRKGKGGTEEIIPVGGSDIVAIKVSFPGLKISILSSPPPPLLC
jgi:hypothetical protein